LFIRFGGKRREVKLFCNGCSLQRVKLSIFSKNLEPIANCRLLLLLSLLKIDDPNWIDDNIWKKCRDAIPNCSGSNVA
jgi:hypothetical protein